MAFTEEQKQSAMTRRGTSSIRTAATQVYERMRGAILSGELAPGQKMAIDTMRRQFVAGATPVREALNRLSSEGLVTSEDLRGFFVVDCSDNEILELFRTRATFFAFLVREAIAKGDSEWEEHLVVAFHRLSKTSWSADPKMFVLNPAFSEALYAFYETLFSGSGSRWFVEFGLRLMHEGDRFFWLVMRSKFETNMPESVHRSLFEAMIARDTERAVRHISVLQERLANTIVAARHRVAQDALRRGKRTSAKARM